jgi:anti-sigma factor RsiW
MTGHLTESVLHDFADGVLDAAAQAEAASHVGDCAACRARVDAVRRLQQSLRALPRDIAPPADVLAGVHARLDALPLRGSTLAPMAPSRGWYGRPALLAAAAVVLVLASSLTTALLLRRGADAPTAVRENGPAGAARLASHPLERTYEEAIATLQQQLAAQQSTLSPDTRRIVEQNLQVIDRALGEARAALQADPANAALADVLRSGYERKLDVLRSAAEHARPAS